MISHTTLGNNFIIILVRYSERERIYNGKLINYERREQQMRHKQTHTHPATCTGNYSHEHTTTHTQTYAHITRRWWQLSSHLRIIPRWTTVVRHPISHRWLHYFGLGSHILHTWSVCRHANSLIQEDRGAVIIIWKPDIDFTILRMKSPN